MRDIVGEFVTLRNGAKARVYPGAFVKTDCMGGILTVSPHFMSAGAGTVYRLGRDCSGKLQAERLPHA